MVDLKDGESVQADELINKLEEETKPEEVKEEGENKQEEKVPFHQDPNVQLYIERQIQKRLGEGNKAWEDRIGRLEQRLSQSPSKEEAPSFAGWKPANQAEAQAAKAIIAAAKQEMLDDLRNQDKEIRETQDKDDEAFSSWFNELKVEGALKNNPSIQDFSALIVKYKLEDKDAAIELWNTLAEAKETGSQEGVKEGIKRAQEAKVGSGRKGGEQGQQPRSYKERRAKEPNFDAILDRELNHLGY